MVFNSVKNYYEILGVSTDADILQIKSAYRILARKYHPDVNKDKLAIDIFKQLNIAYETLINEEERKKYDILNGIFRSAQSASEQDCTKEEQSRCKQESDEQTTKTAAKNCADVIKRNKQNSFSKFIKYLNLKFRKHETEKKMKQPQKGCNITTDVAITPDEVFTGSKRIINIRTTTVCPKCFGHKFTNGDKCKNCGGSGSVTQMKKITLTIPKGVKDGAKLRLKGEGGAGKNGGPNGDVYVKIRIETKTKVHFDKLNIYYNVPITPFEAALGEEISIPAFDGTIKLKLPPNTCSGQKFRIAKQGLKKNNKIGDLIVTVSIEFSRNLSDDEIKLYEQLKNLSSDNVRKNFGCGC